MGSKFFIKPTKVMQLLNAGRIEIDTHTSKIKITISEGTVELPYQFIKSKEWGSVYEKYVGQIKESDGFKVEYNGLINGLHDGGIDLIATNEAEVHFIQCKYGSKKIGKQGIENILYKASNFIVKRLPQKKKVKFVLCLNSIEGNIASKYHNYILSKSNNQFGVKVEIEEIKMNITNGNKS